jgi:hypothetical protein
LPGPPGIGDSDNDSDPGDGPPDEEEVPVLGPNPAIVTDVTEEEAKKLMPSPAKMQYGASVLPHWPRPEPVVGVASSATASITYADEGFDARSAAWFLAAKDPVPPPPGPHRSAGVSAAGPSIVPVALFQGGVALPQRPLSPGQPAPYIPLSVAPSIAECVAYFTLSADQAAVFRRLAEALLDPTAPPVRQLVIGGPGSGKSRSAEAFLWFAYQHGRSAEVAVLSYTWRAALNIATAHNPGESRGPLGTTAPVHFTGHSVCLCSPRRLDHDHLLPCAGWPCWETGNRTPRDTGPPALLDD